MERVRRLGEFWAWLPAFRVVAETQHLPTASAMLGVTPQALSRSIKLLEDQVGRPLFRRTGRRLELNDEGQHFLDAVRAAMRGIDDGLSTLLNDELSGAIRVGASAEHAWMFGPPMAQAMRDQHPALVPEFRHVWGQQARDGLRRGTLDVALGEHWEEDDALVVEKLAEVSYAIVCGRGHPLAAKGRRRGGVEEHAFVVYDGTERDPWPRDRSRRVGARVESLTLALALVASGQLLGYFPERAAVEAGLPCVQRGLGRPRPVYLASRRSRSEVRRTEIALTAIRSAAKLVAGVPRSRR